MCGDRVQGKIKFKTGEQNLNRAPVVLLVLLFAELCLLAQEPSTPEWMRKERNDALHRLDYSEFALPGKYLVPPKRENPTRPMLIVRCKEGAHRYGNGKLNGKFLAGFLAVDAVLDFRTDGVPVEYRIDEGKLQYRNWEHSTDGSGAFFNDIEFNTLVYGHFMPHKENTNPPVRKVIIGVPEYLGAQIQVEFEMPEPSIVGEVCGVVLHKK
jgi:hypothetical protein